MAGYGIKVPEKAIEFYDKRLRETITKNLNLYWQARKFKLFSSAYAPDLVSAEQSSYKPVLVTEIANWQDFSTPVSGVAVDPEIENIAIKLGEEVAFAVEFLIRQEAAKYDNRKNVRNLYVSDIFEFIDKKPNLNVHIVTNVPCSVANPAAMIPGWISYRFHFACGFPVKAESEYKN